LSIDSRIIHSLNYDLSRIPANHHRRGEADYQLIENEPDLPYIQVQLELEIRVSQVSSNAAVCLIWGRTEGNKSTPEKPGLKLSETEIPF